MWVGHNTFGPFYKMVNISVKRKLIAFCTKAMIYYPGVLFLLDFFVSLFLCQQHYEKTAGPICMKFSGNVWSDHGTT